MTPTEPDRGVVAGLIDERERATTAWMRGDIEGYLDLTSHAHGFTLAAPDGGPPRQYEDRHATFEGWRSPFSDGDSRLEVTAVHDLGTALVLVAVERQHGRVAQAPDRDLSLRITEVYRRSDDGWLLVHRHADPLVRAVSIDALFDLVAD